MSVCVGVVTMGVLGVELGLGVKFFLLLIYLSFSPLFFSLLVCLGS